MTVEPTPSRAADLRDRTLALAALLIVLGLLPDVLVPMFGAVIVAVALKAFAAPLQRYLRLKHLRHG